MAKTRAGTRGSWLGRAAPLLALACAVQVSGSTRRLRRRSRTRGAVQQHARPPPQSGGKQLRVPQRQLHRLQDGALHRVQAPHVLPPHVRHLRVAARAGALLGPLVPMAGPAPRPARSLRPIRQDRQWRPAGCTAARIGSRARLPWRLLPCIMLCCRPSAGARLGGAYGSRGVLARLLQGQHQVFLAHWPRCRLPPGPRWRAGCHVVQVGRNVPVLQHKCGRPGCGSRLLLQPGRPCHAHGPGWGSTAAWLRTSDTAWHPAWPARASSWPCCMPAICPAASSSTACGSSGPGTSSPCAAHASAAPTEAWSWMLVPRAVCAAAWLSPSQLRQLPDMQPHPTAMQRLLHASASARCGCGRAATPWQSRRRECAGSPSIPTHRAHLQELVARSIAQWLHAELVREAAPQLRRHIVQRLACRRQHHLQQGAAEHSLHGVARCMHRWTGQARQEAWRRGAPCARLARAGQLRCTA